MQNFREHFKHNFKIKFALNFHDDYQKPKQNLLHVSTVVSSLPTCHSSLINKIKLGSIMYNSFIFCIVWLHNRSSRTSWWSEICDNPAKEVLQADFLLQQIL